MLHFIKDTLWDNPFKGWFLRALLVVNALGSLYGFWWYHNQLAVTPWKYWLFVPDSPLSSTLFTMTAALLLTGSRLIIFELWAYTAVIKYGIWAIVIIVDFWAGGGTRTPTEWMLLLSHGGMALEGFLFLRHLRLKLWHVPAIGIWLLINDYVDYVWGLHPYFFASGQGTVALTAALFLSVLLLAFSWRQYAASQS